MASVVIPRHGQGIANVSRKPLEISKLLLCRYGYKDLVFEVGSKGSDGIATTVPTCLSKLLDAITGLAVQFSKLLILGNLIFLS